MTVGLEGLAELAADFGKASARALRVVGSVVETYGAKLEHDWRANAVATSGTHGKWYPVSIDHETTTSFGALAVDVGPNAAKKQGSMGRGFEYGSVNQPPHLDGHKAVDALEGPFLAAVALAADPKL